MPLRNTWQRGLVLRVLERAGCHLTAEEIHRQARKGGRRIGLATVYRALELFARMGRIERANFTDDRIRFGLAAKHHDHAVCLRCGQWEPLAECLLPRPPKAVPSDFRVTGHRLELYGYCATCEAAAG